MNTWQTIVIAVVSSGALSTLITCTFKAIENYNSRGTAQEKVNQEMLLWRIKDIGRKSINEGCISQEDLEDLVRVYELYKAINGNGFAEALMNKVNTLPLKEVAK